MPAPTGHISAVGPWSIMGTCTFIAQSVLAGEGYTLSSELESLMYVLVFLAVDGAAHWGNKPIGRTALDVKVATFAEEESFSKKVLDRCHSDLKDVVLRLRNLFWQPRYQRNITHVQFCNALQPA